MELSLKSFFTKVYLNNVDVGEYYFSEIFSKYGNSDGNSLWGLVCEAYIVKLLELSGFNVSLIFGHNVGISKIEKDDIVWESSYPLTAEEKDYEKMMNELKEFFINLEQNGLHINISSSGEIPVIIKERNVLKVDFYSLLLWALEASKTAKYITYFDIFRKNIEPFLAALIIDFKYTILNPLNVKIEDGNIIFKESIVRKPSELFHKINYTIKNIGLKLENNSLLNFTEKFIANINELKKEIMKVLQEA